MGRLPAWISWSLVWLSQAGLYLIYTANAGWRELIASALAAGAATLGALVFARQSGIDMHLRWVDICRAWRVPGYVIRDTGLVFKGLAVQIFSSHGVSSRMTAVRFECGGDDPTAAGRRALSVSYTTSTPNSVVLGIFPREQLLLYHQFVPDGVSTMMQNLGARP